MALITSVEMVENSGSGKLQPTKVVAYVRVFGGGSEGPITQIDTHGSPDRMKPGKQSQTFQLDKKAAQALHELLSKTYGF